jgi:hypothetical protein
MAFNEQETKTLELASYVAQQIQMGKKPVDAHLSYLHQIYKSGNREADSLRVLIRSLDIPQLERLLHRSSKAISEFPGASGKRVTLYKTPLPGEAQARVAADSLIARYLSWLARNTRRRAVALAESDHHVIFFIPEGSEFDPEEAWNAFVRFVFSGEELVRTFVAMLNSIKLSKRGFGVPEFPILGEDQEIIILAWLLRSIQLVQKRLEQRQSRMAELEIALSGKDQKKAEKEYSNLKEKQEKEIRKYSENFNRLISQLPEYAELVSKSNLDPIKFLNLFEDAHNEIFKRARAVGELFTKQAAEQINTSRGDYFAIAIVEIIRLVTLLEADNSAKTSGNQTKTFQLRSLLVEHPAAQNERLPGDGTSEFCYVCGELLSNEDSVQVGRFTFRAPYQRLQSVRGERSPSVCRHCVAIAFVSPLKPSDQSVIIQLESMTENDLTQGRSAVVLGRLESFLRGLTLSQLDLTAGNYLMLTSSERVKVGKNWRNLADVVGAVVYAHFRLAELFDYQVFEDYKARIVMGISDIQLESYRLAFLSIFIKAFQLHLTQGGEVNHPLASATRYILADEPIFAIYELVSQPDVDKKRRQQKAQMKLEIEIERSLEVWTKMITEKNRAKIITDVVAMAGLLYPFVDQTLREVRKKNDSSLNPDREASKLIEEVDEVFNFIYRFADNVTYSTARLYLNPTNWFTYEQTKALLEELGRSLTEREKTESNARFLEVNPNDIEAAYKKFAEGNYKADADWRAFTYRLKLALYSRFPGLGVKKEKSQ